MTRTVVDTDILSEFLRGKNGQVENRAQAYLREHGRLSISVVTVFEIIRGRHQANQPERAAQFLSWSQGADVLPFDSECARLGGEIGGALLRRGTTVGVADVLIAATAIVHQATLATANVGHYERTLSFGLTIDNWREAHQPSPLVVDPSERPLQKN